MNKNAIDLKPGLYVLDKEVPNPDVDRRAKRSWNLAPMFPAGTYIVTALPKTAKCSYTLNVRPIRANSTTINNSKFLTEAWNALAAHLKPKAERNLRNVLAQNDIDPDYAYELLIQMVDEAMLKLSSIESVAKFWKDLDAKAQSDRRERHGFRRVD